MPASHPRLDAALAVHLAGDALRPLPTTATFFDAFALPPRAGLDETALRDVFLELSRRTHPDFFATAAPAVREESLRRTALLNNAYKALREPIRRVEYLIFLLGDGIESAKNAIPPELLEEWFDIQEAGEELRDARLAGEEARLAAAEARVAPLREQVLATRVGLERQFAEAGAALDTLLDAGAPPSGAEVQSGLRALRLLLDRMNFLRTVLRNLH